MNCGAVKQELKKNQLINLLSISSDWSLYMVQALVVNELCTVSKTTKINVTFLPRYLQCFFQMNILFVPREYPKG